MESDEFAGQYVTQAVESTVFVDGEPWGHVGLLDVDDVALGAVLDVAERLPGPVAVLSTSPQCWHLWALSIRDLDEWIDRAARLDHLDEDHVALSERRKCGVLRLDTKTAVETGEAVKPAPRLRGVVDADAGGLLSEPHVDLLRERFDADLDVEASEWIGDRTDTRVIMADIGGRS